MIRRRAAEIRALVDAKAREHPELRQPLTLAGLRRVLWREHVRLLIQPHGRIAQLLPLPNGWAVVIDERTTASERLVCGAHELAHLWLHHDPLFPRSEMTVYDNSPPSWDLMQEREANYFAELVTRPPAEPRLRYIATYAPRPRVIIEAQTDSGLCPRCGVRFGIGDDRVPRAVDRDVCTECVMLDVDLSTMECGDVEA